MTDRWAYTLRAEMPSLIGDDLPDAAIASEIKRLVGRAEAETDARIHPQEVMDWWQVYLKSGQNRGRRRDVLLNDFVLLCQGASFVARGRDA